MGVGPGQVATNCKVWGNQKAYAYRGITITHKAGIEAMSWSGSQNYITGWAYEKTNSSIVEGKIGASADLYDGAELLINSTKPIWNAAGEKDVGVARQQAPQMAVGVGAGAVRNIGGSYYAEDGETRIGVFKFSDPLRS